MTTSIDAQQGRYSHLNGSTADLLERFAVSELCKGWPVYRDSSEWKNYRDIFDTDATVWTSKFPECPICASTTNPILPFSLEQGPLC